MSKLNIVLRAICRLIITAAFWIASRLFFTIEVHGVAYDTKAPRSYIALLHRRDLDPIITIPTVLSHRGWRAWAGDVHFALRSDAFSPGYLSHLVQHPRWFAHLLHPISLRSVLPWLGANPVEHLLIRPIEEWIRELLSTEGDMRGGDALSPIIIQALATATSEPAQHIEELPISRLLSWRYESIIRRAYGPEVLIGPIRRRAEQRLLKMAKQHLSELSEWLAGGGSLYGAPEGRLSPDGKLGPVTASLHRVLRAAPADTRIVPMAMTYDFMTVRRLHIFVDFAPAIEYAPTLLTHDLDVQLRTAWLRSAHFTCTQLGSSFLIQRSHSGALAFTVDDLVRELKRQATDLVAAGRHVDARLLGSRDVCNVAEGFLAYALRHGLVRRVDSHKWVSIAQEERVEVWPGEVGYDQMPLSYALNELQEMLSVDMIEDTHN